MTDEKKDVKVREMALGPVVVGEWVEMTGGVDNFVPLKDQPPADVASDVRKVEAWLRDRGVEGEFAIIRGYMASIKIAKVTKVTSAVVKKA